MKRQARNANVKETRQEWRGERSGRLEMTKGGSIQF